MIYIYIIRIDDTLLFNQHVTKLVRKLKVNIGFYVTKKSCFSFNAKKTQVKATFVPVIDYVDMLYMHASF